MSDNDKPLAEVIASLCEGDVVEADYAEDDYTYRVRGPVYRVGYAARVGSGDRLSDAYAVRVISRATPPLPPEPPVGSGVFCDEALWVRVPVGRGLITDVTEYPWLSPAMGTWAKWAEIQPCVPAVPEGDGICLSCRSHYTAQDWADEAIEPAPRDWLADMEAAPVGTLAVFYAVLRPEGHFKSRNGTWAGDRASTLIARYGDPVALHLPKGGA